jgi:Tfp pilus assembly protein PilF
MKHVWALIGVGVLVTACASPKAPPGNILAAPTDTSAKAAPFMAEGERLFKARDLAGASKSFQEATVQQPDLAEAHYNLAVCLDRMGDKQEAKKHYITAANLAPGNKVIWDSPPMHDVGLTYDINRKSFVDPSYRGF